MSEDEDCDELPLITVNSSGSDSSIFAMPSADVVASQRARELACEAELRRLRQHGGGQCGAGGRPPLVHSDSSGSEGEALAAAVAALAVSRAPPAPRAAELAAALAPHLPPPAAALLDLLRAAAPPDAAALLDDLAGSVAAALAAEPGAWADADVELAGALLSVAQLAQEARGRRRSARALQALLDAHAAPAGAERLARALLAALPAPRWRLALADALRSGGLALADRLADTLVYTALLHLLDPAAQIEDLPTMSMERVAEVAAAWRRLDEEARYTCVQLAGRLLAAAPDTLSAPYTPDTLSAPDTPDTLSASDTPDTPDAPQGTRAARARLLAHLAPSAAAANHQRPDRLKVLVGASRLKLLFRAD